MQLGLNEKEGCTLSCSSLNWPRPFLSVAAARQHQLLQKEPGDTSGNFCWNVELLLQPAQLETNSNSRLRESGPANIPATAMWLGKQNKAETSANAHSTLVRVASPCKFVDKLVNDARVHVLEELEREERERERERERGSERERERERERARAREG